MPKPKSIVVVGGSHAGVQAAIKARQWNEQATITLVERGAFLRFSATSLKQQTFCEDLVLEDYFAKHDAELGSRHNVIVKRRTEALSIDVDARILVIQSEKQRSRIGFDSLIYAGGTESKTLDVPGLSGPRVVNFHGQSDVFLIKQALRQGAKRALVIGAGLSGIYAAQTLKDAGLHVSMCEQNLRILPRFSLQFAKAMLDKLHEREIVVALDTTVVSAHELPSGGLLVSYSNGDVLDVDLVVLAVGLSPRVSLLSEAGAALDPEGFIRVDDHMMTTLPNVYACGSVVSVPYAVTNERMWMPEPSTVMRTAQIAGHNAAFPSTEPREKLKPLCGTLIVPIGDITFGRTGLSEHEARRYFGHDQIVTATVFGSAQESFDYQQEMCVKLIANRNSGAIVGGEVYGTNGVLRRIDLLSVAVLMGLSPDRLVDIDMAHVATSGALFDPLQDAASRLILAMNDQAQIMTAEQLALWLKSETEFRLIDVSEVPIWSSQTPRRALHLTLEQLRYRLSEFLESDLPIVLYSKSGHCSYLAEQALRQHGMRNVYHLDGGMATFNLVAMKEP